jgi:hypothetical protein
MIASRLRLFLIPLIAGLAIAGGAVAQTAKPVVEIYKAASCGCCGKWADHMRQAGFEVKTHEVDDVSAARKKLGMPESLGSCHTAKVGGYVVEGHVPAGDVKRLLVEKPKAIGLAVPAMPQGSPGMENNSPVPYETLLVQADGATRVFVRH